MRAAWNGQAEWSVCCSTAAPTSNASTWADGELRTPLRLARRSGHEDIVQMLIAGGAKE